MGGSSLLLPASSICLDSRLQFLSGPERDDAASADRNLLAGLRIASGTLVLIAQIEITESRQLHLLTGRQRRAQLFEEEIDELASLALVEAQLIEQGFSNLRFGQCHAHLSRI